MTPPWVEEVSARSVRELAQALGLEQRRGETWACPACGVAARGSADKRGAIGRSRSGRGWACHRCGAQGDGADLAAIVRYGRRVRDLSSEERRALAEQLAQMGLCTGRWTWQQAPLRAQLPVEPAPEEDPGPGPDEVWALWSACGPVLDDRAAVAYSATRGWGRELAELQARDEMRVTPAPGWGGWPAWWPRGRARCWRLVTRVWSPGGELLGLHGRAVGEPPTVDGRALPKALGHRMRGAGWMMSRAAREELARGLARAIVVEGVADFWALASIVAEVPVLGGVSGSFKTLGDVPWRRGAEVVLLVHADAAGDRYAEQAAGSLGGRGVRLLRRRLGGAP